jgi:hypothetical protein
MGGVARAVVQFIQYVTRSLDVLYSNPYNLTSRLRLTLLESEPTAKTWHRTKNIDGAMEGARRQ